LRVCTAALSGISGLIQRLDGTSRVERFGQDANGSGFICDRLGCFVSEGCNDDNRYPRALSYKSAL